MNHQPIWPFSTPGAQLGRIMAAGGVTLDEARGELRVHGERRAIEAKPLCLLHALLTGAGAIVSKRALITAAWGNADHISEASLTTAISKLRTALGPERGLIEAVHGQGYRLSLPVEIRFNPEPAQETDRLRAGQPIPGRASWRLMHPLDPDGYAGTWLARTGTGGARRVFKFAHGAGRLAALEREVAIAQQVREAGIGDQEIVPIIDWNFDELPYFIERAYGGEPLAAWDAKPLEALGLPLRVAMVARLARTVAAAHAAGILHGEIGPDSVLVDDTVPASPYLRLVRFPAGRVPEAADEKGARGRLATTEADIYALGILLYQMVLADTTRTLAAGWEADIADPLLRQDIGEAAAGDPARRLDSALQLARRLETLPQRHLLLRQRAEQEARQAALARALERNRLRQPWIIGAAASALAGLLVSTVFALRAAQDRDLAAHRAAVAQAVNSFLTEDLLGRGDPVRSGRADETLMQAATAAEAGIDRRLGGETLTAGAIYLSLADAFAGRAAYPAATDSYERASRAFSRAGALGDAPAIVAQLKEAAMLVVSAQPRSMARAAALTNAAQPRIAGLGARAGEASAWLHNALALQQMMGGDLRVAQREFAQAADGADALPQIFEEAQRLTFRRRQAFATLRLGDWRAAQRMMSALLVRQRAVSGGTHPDTLQLELNYAQAQLVLGDNAAALATLQRISPDVVAVFGARHRVTLGLLGERANAFSNLGRYDEAFADQMQAYHYAAAAEGAGSYMALGLLSDAAQSRCRAGRPELGLGLARAAYAGVVSSVGADSEFAQATGGNLALCLITARQSAAAAPLLDRIEVSRVSQMNLDPAYGAQLDLMRAAIALDAGNLPAGRSLLMKAAPTFTRAGADPFLRSWAAGLIATYCPS